MKNYRNNYHLNAYQIKEIEVELEIEKKELKKYMKEKLEIELDRFEKAMNDLLRKVESKYVGILIDVKTGNNSVSFVTTDENIYEPLDIIKRIYIPQSEFVYLAKVEREKEND